MASTHSLNKKPYRRVTPDEWVEIEALYRAGATAKALAVQFHTTERTIYTHAGKDGWLRRDHEATAEPMTPVEADAAARRLGAGPDSKRGDGLSGDAACRGLAADAPLDVAARAAARAAVGMLRDGHVGPAQTYARVAGLLARLDRTVEGNGAGEARGSVLDEDVFAAIRALLPPETGDPETGDEA